MLVILFCLSKRSQDFKFLTSNPLFSYSTTPSPFHLSITDPTALLSGVFVFGAAETDVARQAPARGSGDANTRQQSLNVSLIRPMKKILTTLTVIAATALGAQGQTTNTFPAGVGPNSFTGLTFNAATNVIEGGTNYGEAILLFGVKGATNVSAPFRGVQISGITLSGQGISGTLSFPDMFLYSTNPTFGNYNTYSPSDPVALTTPVGTWLSVSNTVNFTVSSFGGAGMPAGSSIFYAVRYSDEAGSNLNTVGQNINLVAVPEPSTYVAAAGLVALCLWSARRRLFKVAGARPTSLGDSPNGAA